MELQHIGAKVYAMNDLDLGKVIPVFHSWIQNNATDDILIDVADYRHVPAGPGVVLVGHHGNFSVDVGAENRPGMFFVQKTTRDGQNADRIAHVIKKVFEACKRLEGDASLGGVKFGGTDILLFVNDRLLAPNTDASFQAVRADFEAALGRVLQGVKFSIARDGTDARERLTIRVSCDDFAASSYAD